MYNAVLSFGVRMSKKQTDIMKLSLNRNVLILCEDHAGNTWTHLGKIKHVNVNLFKIGGDNSWYDKTNIVKLVEEFEEGVCSNCGKSITKGHMCNGHSCFHVTEWKVKKILKITKNFVRVQWDIDDSESLLPRKQAEEDIPDMIRDFLSPGNGFTYDPQYHEIYRDLRLREDRNTLRENLWSHEDEPTQNTHTTYDNMLCTVDGRWLPKARFSDRRLKWANRGKRYNLHAH